MTEVEMRTAWFSGEITPVVEDSPGRLARQRSAEPRREVISPEN